MSEPLHTQRLERISEVMARTGFRRSSLYAEIAAGRFPKPVRLSLRAVAWRTTEVDDWIAARV